MKPVASFAAFLLLLAFIPRVGRSGTSIYLDVPAIPGLGSPQEYPTSMQVQSFSWAPKGNYFQVSRISDSNSPAFQAYALNGHVLSNMSALFYKTPNEMHNPYLTFTFGNSIVSSVSFNGSGETLKENIQFNYDSRKAIYLKLRDQPGIASAPGYDNVLSLNSFTFDSNGLTITKDVDTASPALAAAVVNSTDFGTADLLFYDLPADSNTPVDPPYDIMALSHLTGSSYQTIVGAATNTEQITFAYSDFNEAPEPSALWLLGIGALAARRRARCAH